MKVKYWFTFDGEFEICIAEKIIAAKEIPCYHCSKKIIKEDSYFKLNAPDNDVYNLCEKCFLDSTCKVK